MTTFTSSHNRPGRVYRVADPGDEDRLATCEYLRGAEWRPAKSGRTRHLAHCLVHGRAHASLTPRGAARIEALAAAAKLGGER